MKILCIDGGGIRGVFAIEILKQLEANIGKPIFQLFDAVAGTSTGSIIAASVAIGKSMHQVMEGYIKHGESIFERKAKLGFFRSIYSDENLRHFIQEEFGDRKLKNIDFPLLIPAVDVNNSSPYVFRSYRRDDSEDILLWDAVLSSCSAPIYFPPNQVHDQFIAIDGGLWANNPSLVSLTEALKHFDKNLNEIQILSIGLGQQQIPFDNKEGHLWGIEHWMPVHFPSLRFTPKLLDLSLHLSSESVSYQCHDLLKGNYLRLNAPLDEEVPFDEVGKVKWLVSLGENVYKEQKDKIYDFLSLR